MDTRYSNYLTKKRKLVDQMVPAAIAAMRKEYAKPLAQRVKLTHYWIATQLQISKGLAFAVLAQVAYYRQMCIRLPSGPIYWDNDMLSAGFIIDAIRNHQKKL